MTSNSMFWRVFNVLPYLMLGWAMLFKPRFSVVIKVAAILLFGLVQIIEVQRKANYGWGGC